MKSTHIITGLFLMAVLTGCKKDKELVKTIDFDHFTLETPVDWERINVQGTDGFFGGLSNKKDTLYFDYGLFSFSSVDDVKKTGETLAFESLNIHGFDAKIVKEKRVDENSIRFSLYIDKRDGRNLNRVYGYALSDEELVRKIFLTHRFK